MRLLLRLDVGVGDAITPGQVDTGHPSLLSMPRPNLLAYPKETVAAETLQAVAALGMYNSRMKDYFDLWSIFITFYDNPNVIAEAVAQTFDQRG